MFDWFPMNRPGDHVAVFSVFAIVIACYQAFAGGFVLPVADSLGYVIVANNLLQNGIFSNGAWGVPEEAGMLFPPLYVGFLSFYGWLNSEFVATLACLATYDTTCQLDALFGAVLVQALLGAATYVLFFATVHELSKDWRAAWLAGVLVAVSGVFADYLSLLLFETWAFCLLTLVIHILTRIGTGSAELMRAMPVVGFLLGLMALGRPGYAYLAYALPVFVGVVVLVSRRAGLRTFILSALAFYALYGLTISPWIFRNIHEFGVPAIVDGYGGFILAQRLAYNMMSWQEYWGGFLYNLPDFGDNLARSLLPAGAMDRWDWEGSHTFFRYGNDVLYKQTLAAAGSADAHVPYLLSNYLVADIWKHFAVTFAIAWRGMWPGSYFAMLGFLCFLPTCIIMYQRQAFAAFFLFSIPSIFMLGFHAFVTVNVTRYNVPLAMVYGFCVALCFAIALKATWTLLAKHLEQKA